MVEVVEGLVTVIIPVFNRPVLVRSAVESVFAQTYPRVETVVVDDGSTDDTSAVLDALRTGHPDTIRVLRVANGGPGRAREAGRLVARGEFIQYLDSDDQLLPNKLELQIAALRKDPDAGLCNGPTLIDRGLSHAPKLLGERLPDEGGRTWFPGLLVSRQWQTGTPLYRRSVTDRAPPWEKLRMYEDWIYEAGVASLCPNVCYASSPLLRLNREPTTDRLDDIRHKDPREHLRHLAVALDRLFGYARKAGVGASTPEFQSFVHHLLDASRRCAEAGLGTESLRTALLAGRGWARRPAPGMALPVGRASLNGLLATIRRPRSPESR